MVFRLNGRKKEGRFFFRSSKNVMSSRSSSTNEEWNGGVPLFLLKGARSRNAVPYNAPWDTLILN